MLALLFSLIVAGPLALAGWASAEVPSLAALLAAVKPDYPAFTFCYQGKVHSNRILVVDKSRQRLFVLRYLGRLVLEYEFPVATGERPGHKQREGDERTPEGIYFTTHRHTDRRITIFGKKAIHLNYPNPFDRLAGRRGNGIYVHGTNRELKPRSSNGCIVMRNEDLEQVARLVRDQRTPIVVVDRLTLPKPQQTARACSFLQKVDLQALAEMNTRQADLLTLRGSNGGDEVEFPRQTAGLQPGNQAQVTGMAFYGLGDQQVLVVDKALRGPGGLSMGFTRRFYLQRALEPPRRVLVQNHWVVRDRRQAAWLASRVVRVVAAARAAPSEGLKAEPVAQSKVQGMLRAWLKAWQAKNLSRYISFYAKDFRGDGLTRAQWKAKKAKLNRYYRLIRVKARNLRIQVRGDRARVRFVQHYRSDWHQDIGIKQLQLVRRRGSWLILTEQWKLLKQRADAS